MQASQYQQAVYDFLVNDSRNIIVEAVAGSGKTSTIIECARLIHHDNTAIFLAFNKAIADELKGRLPIHVQASTLNACGHRILMGSIVSVLDKDKTRRIMERMLSRNELFKIGRDLGKLVSFAKSIGFVPKEANCEAVSLIEDDDNVLFEAIEDKSLFPNEDKYDLLKIIKYARRILTQSLLSQQSFDFDDQIYLPVVFNFKPKIGFDFVFIDELQDVSAVQRHFIKNLVGTGGRVIGVGDECQALYRFRGADIDAMQIFEYEFDCVRFPLSICYRCPRSHVELAQRLVPQILPREGAPVGQIARLGAVEDSRFSWEFEPNDLIMCRTNAPLVKLAYKLLERQIGCAIAGRDFASSLSALVESFRSNSIESVQRSLQTWKTRKIESILSRSEDGDISHIEEQAEMLSVFIENSKAFTSQELVEEIKSFFTDDKNSDRVILSSVHRSKGMTVRRAFILNESLMPHKRAKSAKDLQVEKNIRYVAYTRATEFLGFITIGE